MSSHPVRSLVTFVSHVDSEIHRSERFSDSVIELCSLINPSSVLTSTAVVQKCTDTMACCVFLLARAIGICSLCGYWGCYSCSSPMIMLLCESRTWSSICHHDIQPNHNWIELIIIHGWTQRIFHNVSWAEYNTWSINNWWKWTKVICWNEHYPVTGRYAWENKI